MVKSKSESWTNRDFINQKLLKAKLKNDFSTITYLYPNLSRFLQSFPRELNFVILIHFNTPLQLVKKLSGNDLLGRFLYKSRRPRVPLALPVINNLFFFSLCIRHIHEKTRLFTFYANFWQVCSTSLQSDQNLRGPHVAQQQQLSIDICCKLTQQTRRPPLLLSIDGTDRQTDGRTLDRYMTFTAYYTDRVINLKINRFCVSSTSIYPSKA